MTGKGEGDCFSPNDVLRNDREGLIWTAMNTTQRAGLREGVKRISLPRSSDYGDAELLAGRLKLAFCPLKETKG